jgi:hypothetical protein
MQINRRLTILVFTVLAVSSALPLALPSAAQNDKAAAAVNPFSPFTIRNSELVEIIQSRKAGSLEADLKGKGLVISTSRYLLAAPHILLTAAKGAVSEGQATGGVRVEVKTTRIDENGKEDEQTSTLTGDRAIYTAAVKDKDNKIEKNATIRVVGSVRSVIRQGQLQPLTTNCKEAVVEFLDADRTKTTLIQPDFQGTLQETSPRKKP